MRTPICFAPRVVPLVAIAFKVSHASVVPLFEPTVAVSDSLAVYRHGLGYSANIKAKAFGLGFDIY